MKDKFIYFLIIAIIGAAFLSTWGITESSEARYAEIGREMYLSGNYLNPTELGIRHYHKPPVTYYITAAGYAIFGINETGSRFFLMISLLLQLWLVYKIAKSVFGSEEIAGAAMLVFCSYPIVQAASKNLTTDSYLATFVFAAIYAYLFFRQQQKVAGLYAFYIFSALAFLTKGPVGVLPQAVFAILYHRSLHTRVHIGVHRYLAAFTGLLLAFSWFIILILQQPELLQYFTGHQLVDRVASDSFKRAKPFWYYFAFMPLLSLPAFIYFIDYLISVRKKKHSSAIDKILLITLACCLLVFCASSSKLIFYVLPLYLFIALVSAKHLADIPAVKQQWFVRLSLFAAIMLLSAVIIACFLPLPLVLPLLPIIPMAAAGISLQLFMYRSPLVYGIAKPAMMNAALVLTFSFIAPFIARQNELAFNSLKPVAGFIQQLHPTDGSKIVVYNNLLPSLAFYTNMQLVTVNDGNPSTARETQFEPSDATFSQTYVRLSDTSAIPTLQKIIQLDDIVVCRDNNDLPASLDFIKQRLPKKKKMGKWVIYYKLSRE